MEDKDYKYLFEESEAKRDECRDYLMGIDPKDLTVEDALEALGYGRDGINFD